MTSLAEQSVYQIKLNCCVDKSTSIFYKLTTWYKEQLSRENSKKDSGFDLFVPDSEIKFEPGEIKFINMGVKCAVYKNGQPSPYYLYPRSSVSKKGIILANSVGIIDCGYRGPLIAAFYNTTNNIVTIQRKERLVQICMPNLSYDFNVELVDSLDETERGDGGFGSTGK